MQRFLKNTYEFRGGLAATDSPLHHGPSSRKLAKARASECSQASSSSSAPQFCLSQTDSQASSPIGPHSSSQQLSSASPLPHNNLAHEYPTSVNAWVRGVKFDVNFHHVHRKGQRLVASRLGYAVKYKGCLSGRREPSDIWQHGVQLQYIEDNGDSNPTKIWLCKIRHQRRDRNDAMAVSGTTHIANHLKKVHYRSLHR